MRLSIVLCLVITLLIPKNSLARRGLSSTTRRKIKAILGQFSAHCSVSLVVLSVRDGKPLFSHKGQKTMVPASTLKVITAIGALDGLGPKSRLETKLLATGPIREGRLRGDLVIVGGGDPSLAMADVGNSLPAKNLLWRWLSAVRKAGIKEIKGDVVGEATLFDDQPISRYAIWEDIGNYYGGVTSSLSFNGNLYHLYLSSLPKAGTVVKVMGTMPVHTAITTFDNRLRAGPKGSGDNAYIFGSPMSHVRYLVGTIPPSRQSFKIKGSLPNPAFTCAASLHEKLKKSGIKIHGRPCSTNVSKRGRRNTQLDSYRSPSIAAIVKHMNKTSDNVFAEQLLKLLGHKYKGKGSRSRGLHVLQERLDVLGLKRAGVHLKDGSGLSRYNGITANFLTNSLIAAARRPYYKDLLASLPISGVDGSLKRRYGSPELKGRIMAKTGYMERVFALTGFIKPKSSGMLAFTFVVNDETAPFHVTQQRFKEIAFLLVQ